MTPLGSLGCKTSTQTNWPFQGGSSVAALLCLYICGLTHFRLIELPHATYWKSPISILCRWGYEISIVLEKMAKVFANSEDADQMPRCAASDLGLHCLPITLLGSPNYNGLMCGISLFLIFPSFSASGRLCFASVAFSWVFSLYFWFMWNVNPCHAE